MTLQGYTTPRTATGRASLVPAPPWHYVGDFLVVDYWADGAAASSLLPEGLEPFDEPGRCAAVFVDWQSRSEHGDELTDPVRAQYKEAYIVISALLDNEPVSYCTFIWVDQDFAMARGWIQGFPKKRGEVWITRTFSIPSSAAPAIGPGAAFGATCHARGRELARARVQLDHVSETGSVHTDPPIVNVRYFPRLSVGDHEHPAVHQLVRAVSRDRSVSEIWEGPAELELFDAPGEEHTLLAPVSVTRGYRFTFAYTVDDLITVKELGR
jgi:acetoacetate decarboxylase